MKERTINIVFAVLSAVFGVFLIVFGIHEAGVDTDVAVSESAIDNMVFTVPGILLLADSVIYLLRPRFASDRKFLLTNLALLALVGFIAECVYFQFIHFGIHQPQAKMIIPAILIIIAFLLVVLIINGMYICVRKAAGLGKRK